MEYMWHIVFSCVALFTVLPRVVGECVGGDMAQGSGVHNSLPYLWGWWDTIYQDNDFINKTHR